MNSANVNIGNIIKKELKRRKLTQQDLSKILKVSQSLVNAWIKNSRIPQADYLIKIALIFEIVPELFPNQQRENSVEKEVTSSLYQIKRQAQKLENVV